MNLKCIFFFTKWLVVYLLEHKHNFHVEYFLSITVHSAVQVDNVKVNGCL